MTRSLTHAYYQQLAMRPSAALLFLTAAAFLSLLSVAASTSRPHPLSAPMGGGGMAGREEKVRLGSSPPSCYNKCYECSPCVAVQVPTLSGPAARARPTGGGGRGGDTARADVPLLTFSNYKPLGWKCQCRDRLYDP